MIKKEIKTEVKKEIKDVPKGVVVCEKCGIWMIQTGGGPLGSKDYECPECHAKMTKGG